MKHESTGGNNWPGSVQQYRHLLISKHLELIIYIICLFGVEYLTANFSTEEDRIIFIFKKLTNARAVLSLSVHSQK